MKVSELINKMQKFCTENGVDFHCLSPKYKKCDEKSLCSFWSRDNQINLSARKVKNNIVLFLRKGEVLYLSNGTIVSFKN